MCDSVFLVCAYVQKPKNTTLLYFLRPPVPPNRAIAVPLNPETLKAVPTPNALNPKPYGTLQAQKVKLH